MNDKRHPTFPSFIHIEKSNINPCQQTATEPNNKVFALFGVIKELKLDRPFPDYRKWEEQVYTEAAVDCIYNNRCFDILSGALRSSLLKAIFFDA